MTCSDDTLIALDRAFSRGLRPPFSLSKFAQAFFGRSVHLAASAWTDLTIDDLERFPSDPVGGLLAFMDGAMFQAWVPAWMKLVLEHGHRSDDVLAAVLTCLDPVMGLETVGESRFEERVAALTTDQMLAVSMFGEAITGDPYIIRCSAGDPGPRIASAWRDRAHAAGHAR